MCASSRQVDPKTRRLRVIGNAALVAGLGLWSFARSTGSAKHGWLDALCGLLLGISVGINLLGLRTARRCRPSDI